VTAGLIPAEEKRGDGGIRPGQQGKILFREKYGGEPKAEIIH